MTKLQRTLGHEFNKSQLLDLALTHRSVKGQHNERLEFLGDAVLGMVIAEVLFKRYPQESEGKLTRMRAALVREETLAQVAKQLTLGEYIKLGPGEMKSGGQRRDSILADAVEAILGAIYLDAGFDAAKARVLDWLSSQLDNIDPNAQVKDAKTRLQEYLQGRAMPLPEYNVIDIQGAEHAQTFFIECRVPGIEKSFTASGSSRRKAEQAAAKQALQELNNAG